MTTQGELIRDDRAGIRHPWLQAGVCCAAFAAYAAVLLAVLLPMTGPGRGYVLVYGLTSWLFVTALAWFDRGLFHELRAPLWQYLLAGALVLAAIVACATMTPLGVGGSLERGARFLVVVAAVEELVFRGFVWRRIEEATHSRAWAFWGSTVLFVLMHVPNWLILGQLDVVTIGFTVVWGLLFGGLKLATRNLVLPIAIHAAVDTANILL